MCTGNICRSPMVEVLLARSLHERGIIANVHSAGLLESGRPASSGSIDAMAERGLDLSGHRSTHLTPELVRSSDLVLGLAREHVRESVVLDFSSFPRTYTLKEIVRRGHEIGRQRSGEQLGDWLAGLSDGRRPVDHLGSSADDDVADPIGQRFAVYRRTAEEIAQLVQQLTWMLDFSSPVETGMLPSPGDAPSGVSTHKVVERPTAAERGSDNPLTAAPVLDPHGPPKESP